MTTIDLIRRVAALGLIVTAGVPRVALAQARGGVGIAPVAPVVPGVGIGPAVPGGGIAPVVPSPTAPAPYHSAPPPILSSNATIPGGFGGFGVGGFAVSGAGVAGLGVGGFGMGGLGINGFGVGGFGYPGMYGGFGGPYGGFGGRYGGFGMSLPPTPEFGPGTYRAGNQFPGPSAGMGRQAGVPADPNTPPTGNARPNAIGGASEDPFDAAAAGKRPPSREIRSKRAHAGRRPTASKSVRQPSKKPEAKAPEAGPNRPAVNRVRDGEPAATREKPAAAARADGAGSAARTRSMLGSPR